MKEFDFTTDNNNWSYFLLLEAMVMLRRISLIENIQGITKAALKTTLEDKLMEKDKVKK